MVPPLVRSSLNVWSMVVHFESPNPLTLLLWIWLTEVLWVHFPLFYPYDLLLLWIELFWVWEEVIPIWEELSDFWLDGRFDPNPPLIKMLYEIELFYLMDLVFL